MLNLQRTMSYLSLKTSSLLKCHLCKWKRDIEISTVQSCNRLIVNGVDQICCHIRPHRLKDYNVLVFKNVFKI